MEYSILKYKAFVGVVTSGSFTKTAEEMGYTQPGISRMIQDLEKEWDMVLVERGNNKEIRLTPEGEHLFPYAKAMLQKFRELQYEADELRGLHNGLLRIGTMDSIAVTWLPEILQAFLAEHPGINYELVSGDRELEEMVQDGRLDCAFIQTPPLGKLDSYYLGKDDLMAVLPPDHPLTNKAEVTLEDMAREPHLILVENKDNPELRNIFQRYGQEITHCDLLYYDEAIMAMVEKGLGVSVMWGLCVERSDFSVALRRITPAESREIGMIVRDKKRMSRALAALAESLKGRPWEKERTGK